MNGDATPTGSVERRSRIQAIDRSAAILDAVAAAGPAGIGLTAVAERADLHASTTRTLLSALVVQQFVDQDAATRRYTLGPRFLELNRIYDLQVDVASVAAPFIRQLWEESRETVHLAVLQNGRRVDLAVLVSPQLLNVNPTMAGSQEAPDSTPGDVRSLFTTAAGKILLAWAPDESVDAYLAAARAAKSGRAQLDDRARRAELRHARSLGFALNVEDEEPGVCGIAAPVFNAAGNVAAALCIGYPAVRRTEAYEAALTAATQDVANKISRSLGAGPPAKETSE